MNTLSSMRIALLTTLVTMVCIVLISCGQDSSALCASQTESYIRDIDPLVDEFLDTWQVAESTSRIALSPLVRDMQRAHRELQDVAPPECAEDGSNRLILGVGSIIDGFIAFMGEEDDAAVSRKVERGADLMDSGMSELADLASGKVPQ